MIAYLVFRVCRIIENSAIYEKILKRIDIERPNVKEYTRLILSDLGLIEVNRSDSRITVSLTRAGEFLAKIISSAMSNVEAGRYHERLNLDSIEMLNYIRRNAMSYAAIHSRRIKKYRGSEAHRKKLVGIPRESNEAELHAYRSPRKYLSRDANPLRA